MQEGRVLLNLCSQCQKTLKRYAGTCPFTGSRAQTRAVKVHAPSFTYNHHAEIPGPKSFPIIGTLYKYIPKVGDYDFQNQMGTDRKRYNQFGPLVREKMFPGFTVYHVYDLDLIKYIYEQERINPERFPLPGLKAYRELRKSSKGLALKSGEEWRKERRMASDLLQPSYIANFYSEQIQIANDFNDLLKSATDENNDINDAMSLCHRYALESVGNSLFGRRLGTLNPHLAEDSEEMRLITAVTLAMDSLYHTTYFWPLHRNKLTKVWRNLCASIDFIMDTVRRHIERPVEGSSVSFMKTLMEKPELTKDEAMTLMADVIFAGVESTALVMLNNMYYLAKNPEKQEILYNQIVQNTSDGQPLTREVLDQMKYLKAAMKETFRIAPLGVGNARILTKDLIVDGHTIPKDSLMLLNSTVACMSPEFVDEPTEYRPERWLPDAPRKLHPYMVMPFGLGARSCLGKRLSMMEMQIALVKMLQFFHLEYNEEDIKTVTRFSNTPDRPVKFHLVRRQ